jgi:hypothetical protein
MAQVTFPHNCEANNHILHKQETSLLKMLAMSELFGVKRLKKMCCWIGKAMRAAATMRKKKKKKFISARSPLGLVRLREVRRSKKKEFHSLCIPRILQTSAALEKSFYTTPHFLHYKTIL